MTAGELEIARGLSTPRRRGWPFGSGGSASAFVYKALTVSDTIAALLALCGALIIANLGATMLRRASV